MPWVRYFVFTGGALLALLFVFNGFTPNETAANAQLATVERPTMRIRSEQKWPERIVLDTAQPTIVPSPALASAVTPAPKAVAEIDLKTVPLEAFAQIQSPALKKPEVQIKKRHIAKVRRPTTVATAQQPQFGLNLFAWR